MELGLTIKQEHDGGLLASFDTEAADKAFDFAHSVFGAKFVRGDAVGVQATR